MTLKTSIQKLMRGEHLSQLACQKALDEMILPQANPLQTAAFLVLLHAKQETVEELSAIVCALREKMISVPTQYTVLDIVGTGGDGHGSVNISTGSALLAASCGVKVAKHGNRSVSSLTGSADVLEALGVNIQLSPEKISECIEEVGIGFCYSPNFHPMTQDLRDLRKTLNIPTTFNLLGPLLNPANAAHTVLGVMNKSLLPIMADVLINIGSKRSIIAHSMGLDEISCVGPTDIIEIQGKEKLHYQIKPSDFQLPMSTLSDLKGGNADFNAKRLLETFKGKAEPIANTLILNAAVALYIYGRHKTIHEAVAHAKDVLASGGVLTLLTNWIEFSHDK